MLGPGGCREGSGDGKARVASRRGKRCGGDVRSGCQVGWLIEGRLWSGWAEGWRGRGGAAGEGDGGEAMDGRRRRQVSAGANSTSQAGGPLSPKLSARLTRGRGQGGQGKPEAAAAGGGGCLQGSAPARVRRAATHACRQSPGGYLGRSPVAVGAHGGPDHAGGGVVVGRRQSANGDAHAAAES